MQAIKELQQVKGVGKVLAHRLKRAGITSCQAIVEAGEEGLAGIPGLKSRAIARILEQARECVENKKAAKLERVEAIRGRIVAVRERVAAVESTTRDRFPNELQGKFGRKVTAALEGMVQALNQLEEGGPARLKRTERGLDKAERRMEGLEDVGIRKVRKGLKKSRKAIAKALA